MSAEPFASNLKASFRDPSGFVYKKDGVIFRQVNDSYRGDYDLLMQSGLYAKLIEKGLLIPHEEVKSENDGKGQAYKTLRPEIVPFISYPYEWSFSQLKDAALATLKVQQIAFKYGMCLKDASAYNIQFLNGKPVLIDTLSFERYKEGQPWIAYRQFCQHFLAPLVLVAYRDLRMGSFSQLYLDGIPLDLTSRLLPTKTKYSLGLGSHIHLHARSQERYADQPQKTVAYSLPKQRFEAIIQSLESTVRSLQLPKQKTVWGDYYDHTNYTKTASSNKAKIIESWLDRLKPKSVWDAGANDATYSRLASSKQIFTVASDIDPMAIERAYLTNKNDKETNLLPLIIDLTNPSPSIGWHNRERDSFFERGKFDLTFCLAFIHHLAIANNLPLSYIADMFSQQTKYLIIEFVPKEDSNTQRLLASREDIFSDYYPEDFEKEFSKFFNIKEKKPLEESSRLLYLMEKK